MPFQIDDQMMPVEDALVISSEKAANIAFQDFSVHFL